MRAPSTTHHRHQTHTLGLLVVLRIAVVGISQNTFTCKKEPNLSWIIESSPDVPFRGAVSGSTARRPACSAVVLVESHTHVHPCIHVGGLILIPSDGTSMTASKVLPSVVPFSRRRHDGGPSSAGVKRSRNNTQQQSIRGESGPTEVRCVCVFCAYACQRKCECWPR